MKTIYLILSLFVVSQSAQRHPPATAPQMMKGSAPVNIASGRGDSGDSWDKSFSHAKYRKRGRRFFVT